MSSYLDRPCRELAEVLRERKAKAMMRCPKCKSPEVIVTAWSWAVYKDGVFQTFEPGEYVEVLQDGDARCPKCGAEFPEEATHND